MAINTFIHIHMHFQNTVIIHKTIFLGHGSDYKMKSKACLSTTLRIASNMINNLIFKSTVMY